MPWTRRALVQLGGGLSVVTGGGGIGPFLGRAGVSPGATGRRTGACPMGASHPGARLDPTIVIDGTDVQALAQRALDAATAAGARYAEVRFTRWLQQSVGPGAYNRGGGNAAALSQGERFGVGVRVWVDGAWGFAGSPYWWSDEVVALAREAVGEAKANAQADGLGNSGGTGPPAAWAPIPVARGHWTTPIQVDPFSIPIEDKVDFLAELRALAGRYRHGGASGTLNVDYTREERAVATTEGAYFTQTLYTIGSDFGVAREARVAGQWRHHTAALPGLARCAAGWELLTAADIPGHLPALYAAADPRHAPPDPPSKPGEVGRYTVVFDAQTAGALLEATLGVATQLDRVLGYEANAGGTSYLGPDPLALLGHYQAAAPLVTVTADRSMPRGVGTVKWDDEGVEPEAFPLVQDGILVDYQTTRDLAPLLASYYQQQGRPVRSHGCAWSQEGAFVPLAHMPNLTLQPGRDDIGFDDLVAATTRGLAVLATGPRPILMDAQARTGEGDANALLFREIVNGRLGAVVRGLEFLFTSSTLWRNVVALGGPRSVVQYAAGFNPKGQPEQWAPYSVRAVPLQVKAVDFIDPTRRA